MSPKREKVVVAMSGGVDSSVAACLLAEQGYDVVGLFMRVGSPQGSADSDQPTPASACSLPQLGAQPAPRERRGCCSASDASDARFVAGMLNVPFFALNFEADFDRIIDYFAEEYVNGRTPNPCVVCNDRLKFGKLVDYADAVGARYIATGHYARVVECGGSHTLQRARDASKDQTYVLFGLQQDILSRLLFPIGGMLKSQVRAIAAERNLPNQDKPDSVEICFAPNRDYARVVQQRRPQAFAPGDVVDASGSVIGQHNGIGHFTVGQRRGLGIAAGTPIYVTRLDATSNTVYVGEGDALLQTSLAAERASFLVGQALLAASGDATSFRAHVKIRYLHRAAPATVHRLDRGCVHVDFDEPQRAITPGQAVVFYRGDLVLGGAWITESTSNPSDAAPLSNETAQVLAG
jgi:tRNA-specific 2-thiouridylase